jgi:hypothetical protein
MQSAIVAQSGAYTLTSYGKGLAYELASESGESVFVQGDDAAQFRDEWQAMESAAPDRATDNILSELFAIYGGA